MLSLNYFAAENRADRARARRARKARAQMANLSDHIQRDIGIGTGLGIGSHILISTIR